MDNLSNKDLDFIFQKGMETQEFSFNELAWENMEQMLDDEKNKRTKIFFILSGLILLCISAVVLFGITYFPYQSEIQKGNNLSEVVLENKITSNENSTKHKNVISDIQIKKNQKADLAVVLEEFEMKNSFIISEIEKENSTTKNSKTEKLNIDDIEFKEEVVNNISIDSEKEKSFSQINLKDTKSIKSKLNDKIGVIDSSISFDTNLLPTASLTDFESNIKTLGKVDMEYNKNKSNRFTFGILSAYEYSFVEEVADRCRGYKLGIELAYQFNNNFQISSGISFSKKRYNTAGTNYKPIDAMGIQWKGAPPEVVTGNCNMYEIPIEFTYYLKGYSKNGFFIGTGINSYFITNETYNFDFAPEFQALNKLSWSTEKNPQLGNNNHLFGVVTAQFGYQHYVSKNIAFQVAPYLQIPTTGIGFGDVKLMSTGIQFKMSFAK